MSYLYDGISYDDYDPAFMAALGMTEETIVSVTAQRDYELHDGQIARRQAAYLKESDPLFLEWQYDQAPEKEQAWRAKVAEIKARYPIG
ncbi:hypothetical protein ACW6B7_000003 [Aeromonas veronii]